MNHLIRKIKIIFLLILIAVPGIHAQDGEEIQRDSTPDYVQATFKGTRVINAHSVETPGKKELHMIISHRFGTIGGGVHTFFGLDQSFIRIGFDYGISKRLAVGIGRSSQRETYDTYIKYKLLRQSSGIKNMPVSITLLSGIGIMTFKNNGNDIQTDLVSRTAFANQILIARKFNSKLSLQFSPSLVHRNVVETNDQNTVFAVGFAGRYKFSKRSAITAEYFYLLPGLAADRTHNSASVGIDIETGGHVFQVHLTNSQGMIEQFFIPQTTGDWFRQGMRIGFNIIRVFSFNNKKYPK